MDKLQFDNKGYTLIEMIFVLMIISILTSLTIFSLPEASNIKYRYLLTTIQKAHLDSVINHNKNVIEIYDSNLYINDNKTNLYPLVCSDEYFHFNTQGNISSALTINCSSTYKDYEIKLQLGTGCLTYE